MQTLCLHNWFEALFRTGQVNTYRGGEKKGGLATGMLVDVSVKYKRHDAFKQKYGDQKYSVSTTPGLIKEETTSFLIDIISLVS